MDAIENFEVEQQDPLTQDLSSAEHLVQTNLNNKNISESEKTIYEGIQQNIAGAKAWLESGTNRKLVVAAVLEISMAAGLVSYFGHTQDSKQFSSNTGLNAVAAAEMTRVAPLTTPGAFEDAIKATSQAVNTEGWKSMVERGFPEKAVDSAVQVVVCLTGNKFEDTKPAILGSGNLMHIDGYWVVLTAEHVLEDKEGNWNINNLGDIILARPDSMANSGETVLSSNEYGTATALKQEIDFGVVVFPDNADTVKQSNNLMFNSETALGEDDLAFYKELPDVSYYGIGFPGITDYSPTVSFGARLNKLQKNVQLDYRGVILNNDLSNPGSSGGGEFAKIGDNFYYVGATITNFPIDKYLIDSSAISNIGDLGRSGFNELIKTAIDNYQSKQ